ncbi:hypothetical protein SLEP1_g53511 [Rubroshorea leprosula]|uniref:UspA domain-containing protein n=1 Tax=Rubroshorea leprosula TaxID=152421 RepID=A0AAV5M9T5_9ROSI|nr:hypothetical protein SLEP1_g53511 [Rubroshorea leprosula]
MSEEKGKEGLKKKVMVAIDESEDSYHALMWVLNNLKESFKSSQLVIFATQATPKCNSLSGAHIGYARMYCTALATPYLSGIAMETNRKVSLGLLEKAQGICASQGVSVETATEAGDPKEAICKAVQKYKINLLVIGDRDNGILKRFFHGSLSRYCLDNAKCPVLVVKN